MITKLNENDKKADGTDPSNVVPVLSDDGTPWMGVFLTREGEPEPAAPTATFASKHDAEVWRGFLRVMYDLNAEVHPVCLVHHQIEDDVAPAPSVGLALSVVEKQHTLAVMAAMAGLLASDGKQSMEDLAQKANAYASAVCGATENATESVTGKEATSEQAHD
jgi:hypothetical protein